MITWTLDVVLTLIVQVPIMLSKLPRSQWDATPAEVGISEIPKCSQWDQMPTASSTEVAMALIIMNAPGFMQEDKHNHFLSNKELDTVLPSTGYSIVMKFFRCSWSARLRTRNIIYWSRSLIEYYTNLMILSNPMSTKFSSSLNLFSLMRITTLVLKAVRLFLISQRLLVLHT